MPNAKKIPSKVSQLHALLRAEADLLIDENNAILRKPLSENFNNLQSNHAAAEKLKVLGTLEKLAEVNAQIAILESKHPELTRTPTITKFYYFAREE